jgi:cytochrome c biogenesis protein CcmG, thiol:disulfide interchange protein DsbE
MSSSIAIETTENPVKTVKLNFALRAALVLLTFSFIGVVAYSLRDTSAKEGGPAPEFTIQADSGAQVTPTSFNGKVLVLNFWATWCAPCIQEIPSLNQFQKKFADSGVKVLAISVDKNEGKYKNFLDHVHVSFDTARNPNMDISTKYGTFQYPETYIIKNGRIMRKFPNAANWLSDDIMQYVQSLL